jgi:tetratricopeptide (TPR) repeat protein
LPEARQKALGAEHPDTLAALENLVRTLRKQGELEEAEASARSGLAARERVLGAHHPDTFGNLATLADVLRDQGDASGAELLYQEALDGLENSLGPVHPETLRVLYEYARLQKSQRQTIEARRLAFQLMAARHASFESSRPPEIRAASGIVS